jgi:hypothetical protein
MTLYDNYDLHEHPELLYNLDETALSTNEEAKSAYFPKGTRVATILNPTCGKMTYSILCCGSANGYLLPPFIIYKAAHLYKAWCEKGPSGTLYGRTVSGWMEEAEFAAWINTVGEQDSCTVDG